MTNRDPKIEKIENLLDKLGNTAVESFHYVALFIIGCMVIWSAGHTVYEILTIKQYASIDDILLLFIYLELGAMVGIYFKTKCQKLFIVLFEKIFFSHFVLNYCLLIKLRIVNKPDRLLLI